MVNNSVDHVVRGLKRGEEASRECPDCHSQIMVKNGLREKACNQRHYPLGWIEKEDINWSLQF